MTAKITGKRVMITDLSVIEGERLVDKIVFELPSSYGEVLLSGKLAYVNIRRADGTTDKIIVSYEEDGQTIFVTWQLDATATAVPGELDAHLSFESEEGDVIYMTERFTLKIQPSVDAYRDMTDRSPNAIHRLQLQMQAYVARMQELVDEVNEKIESMGTGSGTGGAASSPAYGEDNKLPAAYVDGLAVVATSGSYADLLNAPDISLYATNAALAQKGDEITEALSPVFLKYVTFDDEVEDIIERSDHNKAVLSAWKAGGCLKRAIYLVDESTNTYYPVDHAICNEDQVDVFFVKDSASYVATYNSSTDSFGFSA